MPDINVVIYGRNSALGKLRPSNPAIDAFYMKSLGMKLHKVASSKTGYMYDVALVTMMYDLMTVYQAHLDDTIIAHSSKDPAEAMVAVYPDFDAKNVFAGEYAKYLAGIDLKAWNFRQIERNETWSDVTNLIGFLYDLTNMVNGFKASFTDHCLTHDSYAVAVDPDNEMSAVPVAAVPTPDGIVPSLKYNCGYSKYLVELERTEPAFIKGRVGEWIKNILELLKEIIPRYANHAGDLTGSYHNAADTVNVFSTKPIRQI